MEEIVYEARVVAVLMALFGALVGWRLDVWKFRWAGKAMLASALVFLTWWALTPSARSIDFSPQSLSKSLTKPLTKSTVIREPVTVQSLAVNGLGGELEDAGKDKDTRFIASAGVQKTTYHIANGCWHAKQIKTAIIYETRGDAERDGKTPCTNCFKEASHVSLK